MPKREDETYRNIHPHPPYCTCWECTQRRLKASRDASLTAICPVCRKKSLFYNRNSGQYECLNLDCKATGRALGEIRTPRPRSVRWDGNKYVEVGRERTYQSSRSDTGYPFDPDHVGYYREEYPRRIRKSGGLPSWLLPALVLSILVAIASFFIFSDVSSSPPTEVSELPPEETATPPETSSGGVEIPTTGDGISIFRNTQPFYSKTLGGERIELINNKDASDPTWQELKMFLLIDITDERDYSLFSYPCGAFAEEVHNNAEAAGIKAAWVAVQFEQDSDWHALNAFSTIDKGLVFMDCTGQGFSGLIPVLPYSPGGSRVYGDVENWDKIVYVQVGKTYGLVSLEADYGPEYSDYEQWQQDKLLFDSKRDAYIRQLGGRLLVPEDEYRDLMRQLAELDALASRLGGFWEPLGIVKKVEIYW